ncbi:MAG: hypothetical protein A2293_15195 [Elusimicrobia bacterium RIFOXYB2_FULL_49_7]|nr:MAG: hypothetical protein A2293_15195 [Elusimicrobia bacterium RIFOXYB2_FULL_49_7]
MAKTRHPAEEYKMRDILSAGKLKSIQLLLNRSLVLLKTAVAEPEKRNECIIKTQNILAQFEAALNFREGSLSGHLFYLFDYIFVELNHRDESALKTAIDMLTQLKETFAHFRTPLR